MERLKPDFTAVVREEGEIHILKAKILDDNDLLFQMFNRTTKKATPCFKIPADYGFLGYVKPDKFQKSLMERRKLTKYVNRDTLTHYFSHFKLQFLIGKYHDKY